MIYTMKSILVPGGIALDKAPLAARSDLHFVNNGRIHAWAPPLRYQIWIAERLEDDLAGCLEVAVEDNLGFSRFSGKSCASHLICDFYKSGW